MKRRQWIEQTAFAAGGLVLWPWASAQEQYPVRPIRILVGFPPGGATDIAARQVGERLTASLGQPVIIENRPGAGGNIAAELLKRATPDGYTLMMGTTSSHSINPTLYKNLTYDPLRDFEAITQVLTVSNVLLVNDKVPVRTVHELIKWARAQPGKSSYGSIGNGTASHIGMELLKRTGNFYAVHIPYRGSGPAITGLIGGEVDMLMDTLPSALPHIRSGRVRAIAVAGSKRAVMMPEIPTIAEAGYPTYEANSWYGLFAPKGTPQPVVARLADETRKALATPELVEKFKLQGADVVGSTPADFKRFVEREYRKWGGIVQIVGAKPD